MLSACGGAGDEPASAALSRPTIAVTTSILADVVRHVVGDEADVDVIVPVGADPHEFAPSTRQAEAVLDADVVVRNGAGLEQRLDELVDEAADHRTPVFTFADHVALRQAGRGADPHVWTDPHAMAGAVAELGAFLSKEVGDLDGAVIGEQTAAYGDALQALDGDVEHMLAPIPAARRVLVTNHDSFAYFADRYGLRVLGTVIPSLTTSAGASAGELEALATTIRREGVPAIFAETTQPSRLADALAGEVGGDVAVVELYTESLGEPGSGADTYIGMIRTDAERIAEALA